jgi:hypothetical protein
LTAAASPFDRENRQVLAVERQERNQIEDAQVDVEKGQEGDQASSPARSVSRHLRTVIGLPSVLTPIVPRLLVTQICATGSRREALSYRREEPVAATFHTGESR